MSYEKYYPNGWQSGETGGTPITPEALNHMEQGIANLDSEKAPAGYGLGESAKINSDESLDNLYGSGFYWWETAANTPFDWGYMIHIEGGESATQIAWSLICDYTVTRKKTGSDTWSEWEWVNPPMVAGVEYRTTERWNGKAVYTKLLNCGKGANGLTEIPHDTSITNMLRCAGTLGGVWALPFFAPGGLNDPYTYWCNATRYAIQIYVGAYADVSTYNVHVQMWYTKD